MNKYIIFLSILLILIFLIESSGLRYKYYLPTFSFLYPNSYEEVKKVIKETNERTDDDINFFYLTDNSVIPAFQSFTKDISSTKLKRIILSQNKKIFQLKNFINRPRPHQISNEVKLLKSNTAHTPAFPAGHAAQAYILANYLQKIYPDKKKILEKIADKCNDCRIKAGLHYPSDGMYSKLIFYKT